MSLFRSSLRPPASISDQAVERYLAMARSRIEPDPLFRRRLRGRVMNRFVAAQEGVGRRRSSAKEMGRLGRAVLYATFALGLSVTGAMAASEQAIPGDALYPVKLQIEAVREQIVPERLRDELAVYSLGERINELQRLTEAGRWGAVAAHAAAVEAAYDRVVALSPDARILSDRLAMANGLLERLPEQARVAVQRAMSEDPAIGSGGGSGGSTPSSAGAGSGSDAGGPGQGSGREPSAEVPPRGPSENRGHPASDAADATPRPEPKATKSPKPAQSPGAMESPDPTNSPDPTESPEPTD